MGTEHKITGVVIDATRMKSSKFGNPRYVVTVNENGVHMTYRTMPDMPIGAEIPELVGKRVELTVKEHYGRWQVMYGHALEDESCLPQYTSTREDAEALATALSEPCHATPIVAAGNKPKAQDRAPDVTPKRTVTGMKIVEMTDHEFAAFLRKKLALDNYTIGENANTWYDPMGKAVAIVVYDNANCTRAIIIDEE